MSAALHTAQQHYLNGRLAAAEAALRRGIAASPRDANLHSLLGVVLSALGQPAPAFFAFERALAIDPEHVPALANFGTCLFVQGYAGRAREYLERAIALNPHELGAWLAYAGALYVLGLPVEAAEAAERGHALSPDNPSAIVNLGSALVAIGSADRALALLRPALMAHPAHASITSNYLSTLHYAAEPALEPGFIAAEHARLGPRLAQAPIDAGLRAKADDPERRLRLAYLSSDLRGHSVAAFMRAILPGHDRSRFEVLCVQTGVFDRTTESIAGLCDRLIDGRNLSDPALAERLLREKIDVLIELNGHTQGHRLGVVSRRVAPVQLTYLGYPDCAAVPSVDGRLVDAITDPPGGEGERPAGLEPLLRLPRCFLAWSAPGSSPEVRPREGGRPVTFGSFNALPKLNPPLLRMYGRVLAAVPGSRLVLKNRGLDHERVRGGILDHLAAEGIGPERVETIGWQSDAGAHWASFDKVDIALDSFPYHGTTTTCEALWMGLPVVTLAGRTHASRVGESLLSAVGLGELVARDEAGFVELARSLAADSPRLAGLRAGMRDRLKASPVMDGAGLARAMEGVCRGLWAERCTANAK
jgi:protein O-GlcNAc transferase